MCVKPGGMYGEEKGQLKLSREKRKGGKGFERDGSEPAEISDQSGCVLGRTRGTTLCPALIARSTVTHWCFCYRIYRSSLLCVSTSTVPKWWCRMSDMFDLVMYARREDSVPKQCRG